MNKKFNINISNILVCIIFICIFIIPSLSEDSISLTKYLFLGGIVIIYLMIIDKIYFSEIIFIFFILLQMIFSKSINSLALIGIILLEKLIKKGYNKKIKSILLTNNVVWISLVFTILYSFLYMGNGRYAYTAIGEINQSGLAILCLGLIIKKRRNLLGNIVILFGILTFSRNYILGVVIIIFLGLKPLKKLIKKYLIYKRFNFTTITVISTIILLLLGGLYQNMHIEGKIVSQYDNGEKLFKVFDRSNYFRFTANTINVEMYLRNPKLLITGVADIEEYRTYCREVARETNQFYVGNTPHNFIFSYLRLYGILVICAFIYISRIMSRVINENNYNIFLAIMCYAIFLSAGFNTYWLFLTYFTLIIYHDK